MDPRTLAAFVDELEKIAAKVPFIHGTAGRWPVLQAGVGSTILKNDPNPRGIYTTIKNRNKMPSIERFAVEAERSRGMPAAVAHGKMDTKKGWKPSQLTPWGKANIGELVDAHALVDELDRGVVGDRRGEIWRMLHKGTGAWSNSDPTVPLKVTHYSDVATPQVVRQASGSVRG